MISAADIEKNILFEDGSVLLCYKEAGIPVQSARLGTMDMENALKNYLAGKKPGKLPYLGVIHRLDQPVEGLLLFAKTPEAARELGRQLTEGRMGKHYLAVVQGNPAVKKGNLKAYLKKDGKTNTSYVTVKGTPGSKEARLFYQVVEEKEEESLLRVELDTGRHHQIRVQLSQEGYPIVGDQKYGERSSGKTALALCSYELCFCHPGTKRKITWRVMPKGEVFRKFSFCQELQEGLQNT